MEATAMLVIGIVSVVGWILIAYSNYQHEKLTNHDKDTEE